jgi:hypothetical protein
LRWKWRGAERKGEACEKDVIHQASGPSTGRSNAKCRSLTPKGD